MNARTTTWIVYAAICLIWGTTWLAIKIGLESLGPLTGVGMRFVVAGALLYAIAFVRRDVRPLNDLPWKLILTLATCTIALDYGLIYTAETHLSPGLVAVLFGTLPFFSFAFSRTMLGERAAPRVVLGACIGFVGVGIVTISGTVHGSPLYALATIGGAASAAYANVYAKRYGHVSPLVTLPPAMLIGGASVLVIGIATEHTDWHAAFSVTSIAALLYLAVAGSGIAFCLMLWLLARLSAGVVGMSSLLFPAIAVVVGMLFGGEQFSRQEFAGCALVVAGMATALVPLDLFGRRTAVVPAKDASTPKERAAACR
jgi:drug/metabolite transporter (DMT)-like permease